MAVLCSPRAISVSLATPVMILVTVQYSREIKCFCPMHAVVQPLMIQGYGMSGMVALWLVVGVVFTDRCAEHVCTILCNIYCKMRDFC